MTSLLEELQKVRQSRQFTEEPVTDEQLAEAQQMHREASMRYDFVMSENSTGFHSPQEAARVLADAINFARLAQLEAERLAGPAQSASTVSNMP